MTNEAIADAKDTTPTTKVKVLTPKYAAANPT
jgi:hypothetical protein